MDRVDMTRKITAIFLLILIVVSLPSATRAAAATRDLPIYCVERDDNVVSLTFDTAWGNDYTQQLLEILTSRGVRATFFVLGGWVDQYPDLVRAIFRAGHEVMNHSNTHPEFTKLTKEAMAAEVNACADKIEAVTGVRPDLFRPPYGDYNDTVIGTMRENGFISIQWDVDSLDWQDPGSDAIVSRVLSKVKTGSIILLHNAAPDTPGALVRIIDGLIARGFRFVLVSELIYRDHYYMDHTGMQIKTEGQIGEAMIPMAADIPFIDVPPGAWYYNDVKAALEIGLINGKAGAAFAPDDHLTYAEAIKLAACMHQLYDQGKVTLTSGSPWYQPFVEYSIRHEIIKKDYNWNSTVTRGGYMEIFAAALPYGALPAINTVADGAIPDVPMSNAYAAAIYRLYRAGIMQGVDKAHNCNPDSNIKRSEVAAILTRMMNPTKRLLFEIP